MMENEVRLIDANGIVKVAERAYHEWCLAMVGADDTRKVDEVFKKQYLCKVVKAVAENCPTIDPESLRPKGRWNGEKCNHKPCRIKNPEKWLTFKCSVCEYSNGRKQSNYCPNCGADMLGV